MRADQPKGGFATNPFLNNTTEFTNLGLQHWVVLLITLVAAVALPMYARRRLNEAGRLLIARIMAVTISGGMVLWMILRLARGELDWREDLPLDICNLLALLIVVLMWTPTRRMHVVLYFLVLSGTLQGALTPDLPEGFPHYNFMKYWLVHSGMVVYVIYITASHRFYPDLRSLVRSFAFINVYAAGMCVVNIVAGTNYFYLKHKPPSATLLDLLGPWPWYILLGEALAVVLLFLAYLPVARLSPAWADS